ncbi:MAG TPA: pyridoxamine 5'-phosphate oxidase family protein [Solirubrobacteraceae bacterium]|nr:pyridoxamine 5'-phosphate oxidase family protein [Solirubrobacteraceae bacterium]
MSVRAHNPDTEGLAPSERVRLRRKRERGSYERAVIDAILDEALVAHLGIVEDGQPLVIPTLHAREGDVVYCHGSSASRTLRALAAGARACLTVTLIDGLVLARSAMHHSANYRSAMLLGRAQVVTDEREKRAALRAIVEHIVPGRWSDVREPTENELKATAVLAMPIAEASAKVRTGGPVDDEEDYALDAWAGVIPLASRAGAPEPDARLRAGIAMPAYASAYRRSGAPSRSAAQAAPWKGVCPRR